MAIISAHKVASVVYRLGVDKRRVEYTREVAAVAGNALVARVLGEKRIYNELELANGRMAPLSRGDVIVGALGRRRALQGFVGDVPARIAPGDTLQILNRGGVLGASSFVHKDLGAPAAVEVIGMAVRNGRPLNVAGGALAPPPAGGELRLPPVVVVFGTGMNSGKTFAACTIIQQLARRGRAVHAGKLTGIACRRDPMAMEDHGAARSATFLDAGLPSTAGIAAAEVVRAARTVLAELARPAPCVPGGGDGPGVRGGPDVIVLELGDGILGDYGVLAVLESGLLAGPTVARVFCAGDLAGAWGGERFLAAHGVPIDIVSGRATDTPVGVEFIERSFGVAAINSRLAPEALAEKVEACLARGPLAGAVRGAQETESP